MPKRKSEGDSLDYIVKKLKYLEEEIKRKRHRSRHRRRVSSPSLTDSSSSSSNSRSSQENVNDRALTDHEETPIPTSPAVPALQEVTQEEVVPSQQQAASPQPTTSPALPVAVPQMQTDQRALTQVEDVTQNVPGLSADIMNILGVDPTAIVEYGSAISTDLANRLQHIVTSGLKKEDRNEFEKRYLIPENCQLIAAPIMNAEVKATLTEINLKRDKAIESRQKSFAIVISCLSKAITTQINSTEPDHELLQQLVDATRLLCDIQYINSTTRKTLALSYVKKEIKEQISNTKIGKHLFGDNFIETIENVKAISKSSAELKIQSKKPDSSSKNLNWKTTSETRRLTPAQSALRRQPPPPAASSSSIGNTHRRAGRRIGREKLALTVRSATQDD